MVEGGVLQQKARLADRRPSGILLCCGGGAREARHREGAPPRHIWGNYRPTSVQCTRAQPTPEGTGVSGPNTRHATGRSRAT